MRAQRQDRNEAEREPRVALEDAGGVVSLGIVSGFWVRKGGHLCKMQDDIHSYGIGILLPRSLGVVW